jgi:hypothetical protein
LTVNIPLSASLFQLDFIEPLPIQVEVSDAPLTSDAGPLGKGQPATWRLLLIKEAATVLVSCRRIVVRLSGSWPNRDFLEHISQHVSSRPEGAACWTG